jgi:hypothetical protein
MSSRLPHRFDLVSNALLRNSVIVSWLVLIVASYFLFLFFYNPTLFYNVIGWLDPYMYVGYGLYYGYPDFRDAYYKASRLPWDLLEFAARHLFRPKFAPLILQSFCCSLMSASIFLYFQRLLGRSNALFLAILSIFLPILYMNGGADYHNAISGPLYFLTLALLVAAIAEQSLPFAGCAGAAAAAAIHTNPLLILLAPAVSLQSLALCWTHKRNTAFMFTSVGIALVGFVCATIVLGLIAVAFGRSFLFFEPQIEYIRWIQQENHNSWWRQFSWQWLRDSKSNAYLIGMFVICAAELVAIALRRRAGDVRPAIAAYAGYVLSYLWAVGYQLAGRTTLQPDYLNYMLVVGTFTPLGYLLERYLPPLSRCNAAIMAACLPLASALALLGSSRIYAGLHLSSFAPFFLVMLTLAGIYLALVAFSTTRLNVAIVLLPLLTVGLIPDLGRYRYDSCRAVSHANVFINEASSFVTEIAGNPKFVYLFADPNERLTNRCFADIPVHYLNDSLVELAHNYLGKPFGEQQLDQLTRDDFSVVLKDHGIIGLLVAEDAIKDRFGEVAAKLGINLQLAGLLPDSASGVKLYVFRAGVQ